MTRIRGAVLSKLFKHSVHIIYTLLKTLFLSFSHISLLAESGGQNVRKNDTTP